MDQNKLNASNGYLTYTFSGGSRYYICRTPHFMLIPCGQSKIFSPIVIGFYGNDIVTKNITGIFINDDPDNLIVIDQEHLKLKVSIADLSGWGATGLINLIPSDKVPYNVTWEAS